MQEKAEVKKLANFLKQVIEYVQKIWLMSDESFCHVMDWKVLVTT